jgi:hypothetical protein
MTQINRKKLIISLIKDDMINTKLVLGLNASDLFADGYFLHLSQTIFELMGFKDDEYGEQVYEFYMKAIRKTGKVNINQSHQPLDKKAKKIYKELVSRVP